MKLRTQLTLAYLLLAFAPLAGIVFFSYVASEESFRTAVKGETKVLAEGMGEHMAVVRSDLTGLVDRLEGLPLLDLTKAWEEDGGAVAEVYARLMEELGETAPLVESLEFVPLARGGLGGARGAAGSLVIYPSQTLADAVRRLGALDDASASMSSMEAAIRQVIRRRDSLDETEIEALEAMEGEARELLGMEFCGPVEHDGELVGEVTAQVRAKSVLRHVLARARRGTGEISFVVDDAGGVYFSDPRDEEQLQGVLGPGGVAAEGSDEWIVAKAPDPDSNLTFGLARPIRDSLQEMRTTAVRNFTFGLAMMAAALVGIVLWSARLTRKVALLAAGAERLAEGDLDTRVLLDSKDELGRLASTFNRMASEIQESQQRLIEEERERREREVQQRLLGVQQRLLEEENARKSRELEEARRFQLSLLPKSLPSVRDFEIDVFMRTATEVGGDYYDFHQAVDGRLTAAIGDATGHGATAGTMVTVVKGLFAVSANEPELPGILRQATRAIRGMNLERMNMALSLVRLDGRVVTLSSAGMPPALVYSRRRGEVSEVVLPGTPLGGMADYPYEEWRAEFEPGDVLLLMTDGFPELRNGDGEPLGYERARSSFAATADQPPSRILTELVAASEHWNGGRPPDDDITFMVLRARGR